MFRLIGFLLRAAVFFAFVFAVVYFFGSRVPREKTAIVGTVIHAPQAKVWSLLNDPQAQVKWRAGLRSVSELPSRDGHPCWLEAADKKVSICETAATPPNSRSLETTSSEKPYTASWTYKLTAVDERTTEVTARETNVISSPVWRFVGHYVAREDTVVAKSYLDGLKGAAEQP